MNGATVVEITPGQAAGSVLVQAGIQIYDKAGVRLGAVTNFSPQSPASRGVNFSGSFSFHMPRLLADPTTGDLHPNPDLYLIPDGRIRKGDRLVVYADSLQPNEPWGGVITDVEWTDGSCIVQCADIFDLLTTPQLPQEMETRPWIVPLNVTSGSSAAVIAQLLINQANGWFGAQQEVLWGVDASGSATFFGDESLSGDVASVFSGTLVERSFGEYLCRVELTATSMRPVLVWRDQFLGAAGCVLDDGPEGNIVATPSMSVNPTEVVNAIRVTGAVTTIVDNVIPENATAARVQPVVPVAEVWAVNVQGYRRRFNTGLSLGVIMHITVPFTISANDQTALDNAEETRMRALFVDFIHAYHDQYGMPWRAGGPDGSEYSWNGSYMDKQEDMMRVLTADRYTHHNFLAAGPTHVVMAGHGGISDSTYLAVNFDPVENEIIVHRVGAASPVDTSYVFDFEWRGYELGGWSPYSDGVGQPAPYTTVSHGALTTSGWRIVAPGIGDKSGSASLLHGIAAGDTSMTIDNPYALPGNPPFVVTVDGDEDMLVTGIYLNVLSVTRGFNGTVKSYHTVGATVEYNAAASTTDPELPGELELPPIEVPFPDGLAYAERLLAKLNSPKRMFTAHMANVANDVSTVGIGTIHPLRITTEGPPEGIDTTVRCVGFAPSWFDPSPAMELLLQEV